MCCTCVYVGDQGIGFLDMPSAYCVCSPVCNYSRYRMQYAVLVGIRYSYLLAPTTSSVFFIAETAAIDSDSTNCSSD